jgi:2-polyprenyl-3-methyl-5-hydroxy-6-metoxy-1,4-benzoquinol methylase
MDSLAFHRQRYANEPVLEEVRWSRIQPCLRMVAEEHHRIGRPISILDAGCGDDTISRLLLEAGHRVWGVDLVPELVQRALEQSMKARTADVGKNGLPFRAGEMDVVNAGALIEHLYDPEFFVGECRRVLKEGGIFLLSTPNAASLTSRLRILFGKGQVPRTGPGLGVWRAHSAIHCRDG